MLCNHFINNSPRGFKFDNYFGLGDYSFGDYNGISGNGYIYINPAFGIMSINTENLYFSRVRIRKYYKWWF